MVFTASLTGCSGQPAVAQDWIEIGEPVKKDVPYVPTPEDVVAEMVRLAQLDSSDTLIDLGSGDGRIVIAAAKQYGAHGIGIDIDPQRIRESNENAQKAGVTDRVQFIKGNLFEADLSQATAVTMYLLPRVNLDLRPKLLSELKPGTPVVSHAFDMGDWQPDQTLSVGGRRVYLWIIPANVEGTWKCSLEGSPGQENCALDFGQTFQQVSGTANIAGTQIPIEEGRLAGDKLTFSITREQGEQKVKSAFSGVVQGDSIQGNMQSEGMTGQHAWSAQRQSRMTRLGQETSH
jgi:hypothetical protein